MFGGIWTKIIAVLGTVGVILLAALKLLGGARKAGEDSAGRVAAENALESVQEAESARNEVKNAPEPHPEVTKFDRRPK